MLRKSHEKKTELMPGPFEGGGVIFVRSILKDQMKLIKKPGCLRIQQYIPIVQLDTISMRENLRRITS